eukprot:906686-Alexandrium_andersonii.AAC.1
MLLNRGEASVVHELEEHGPLVAAREKRVPFAQEDLRLAAGVQLRGWKREGHIRARFMQHASLNGAQKQLQETH